MRALDWHGGDRLAVEELVEPVRSRGQVGVEVDSRRSGQHSAVSARVATESLAPGAAVSEHKEISAHVSREDLECRTEPSDHVGPTAAPGLAS